jgi:hypothetical protein
LPVLQFYKRLIGTYLPRLKQSLLAAGLANNGQAQRLNDATGRFRAIEDVEPPDVANLQEQFLVLMTFFWAMQDAEEAILTQRVQGLFDRFIQPSADGR